MARKGFILAALVLVAGLVAGPDEARAETSFNFLFSVNHVDNDSQLFLNLAVSSYGYNQTVLEPVLPRLKSVENDLPVVLFLARKSGRPVNVVVGLRARGLSWSVIFGKVNVPFDVLFVGLERDPGPPYGKAWGHWKKRSKKFAPTDADVVGLVQVQMGSRWAGMSPYELARARGQGKHVHNLVADKKGRPHKSKATVRPAKSSKSDKPGAASLKKSKKPKSKAPKN